MQAPILKTYNPELPIGPHSFYILCKGNHSGRPMNKPLPNCFVAICTTADQCQYWMAICTALWIGRKFEYLLKGSVIPFIRITETRHLLASLNNLDAENVHKIAAQLHSINQYQEQMKLQALKIQELKIATALSMMKQIK
jgi:hypothetical protein